MISTRDAVFAAAIARPELRELRRVAPRSRARSTSRPRKPRRHDADDLERRAVDEHGPSEHVRIAIEAALPPLVAQHDHRVAARPLVIGRSRARVPSPASTPSDLEEIPGDERHRHHPAVDPQIDVGQRRIGIGEDAASRVAAPRTADASAATGSPSACSVRSTPYMSLTAGTESTLNRNAVQEGKQHRHHAESDRDGRDDR